MFNFQRGISGTLYWVFSNEDEAMRVFWIIRILRFFGMKCHGSCFNGYYNSWELF